MKKILYTTFALVAGLLLYACHDELVIPDPGFDMTESRIDTVRRDTAQVYKLSLNVKAPNGVDCIQLLNGRNFQVIKDYPEHVGKTNFRFETEISLADCDENRDSMFIYNLKIRTKDNRSYNKSIRIQHLKLSKPEMVGPGGNTMNGFGRAFVFEGTILTGYYTVESVKAYLNNEEVYSAAASDMGGTQYRIYHKLTRDYVTGQTYKYKVVAKDSNGTEKVWEYNLVAAALKKPVAISCTNWNGSIRETVEVYYNEKGLVERVKFPGMNDYCMNYFYYDENDRCVCKLAMSTSSLVEGEGSGLAYWYAYNEDGSLRRYVHTNFITHPTVEPGAPEKPFHRMSDRTFWLSEDEGDQSLYPVDRVVPTDNKVSGLEASRYNSYITKIYYANDVQLNTYYTMDDGTRYNKLFYGINGNKAPFYGDSVLTEDYEEGKWLYTDMVDSMGQGCDAFYGTKNWSRITYAPVLNPLYIKDIPLTFHWRYTGPNSDHIFLLKYVATSYSKGVNGFSGVEPLGYVLRDDGLLKEYDTWESEGTDRRKIIYYYDDEPRDWESRIDASVKNKIENYM